MFREDKSYGPNGNVSESSVENLPSELNHQENRDRHIDKDKVSGTGQENVSNGYKGVDEFLSDSKKLHILEETVENNQYKKKLSDAEKNFEEAEKELYSLQNELENKQKEVSFLGRLGFGRTHKDLKIAEANVIDAKKKLDDAQKNVRDVVRVYEMQLNDKQQSIQSEFSADDGNGTVFNRQPVDRMVDISETKSEVE